MRLLDNHRPACYTEIDRQAVPGRSGQVFGCGKAPVGVSRSLDGSHPRSPERRLPSFLTPVRGEGARCRPLDHRARRQPRQACRAPCFHTQVHRNLPQPRFSRQPRCHSAVVRLPTGRHVLEAAHTTVGQAFSSHRLVHSHPLRQWRRTCQLRASAVASGSRLP